MKGLILKDFLVLRKYLKTLLLMTAVYVTISFVGEQSSMLTGLVTMMGLLVVMSLFSYDAQAGWDRYGASLPVTRCQMVGARYLVTLITVGAGTVLGMAAMLLFVLLRGGNPGDLWRGLVGMLLAALTLGSILLPILYRFGPERGRLILVIVVLLPVLAVGAFIGLVQTEIIMWLFIGFVALALLLPIPSYLLSCRIMERKEF